MPSNIGYHIATWLVTVVIGLGMITVLNDYPNVFLALKISGAAFVLWLAWKLFRVGRYDGRGEAKPATFWDGVILLILNPKAYIIMALMSCSHSKHIPIAGRKHLQGTPEGPNA